MARPLRAAHRASGAAGLTIGGALPVSICYINEVAPTATRGRFFGTFQFLMTSGFGLAALLGVWLIPAFGWQIMFALGAVPLIVLPFTRMLPESPSMASPEKAAFDEAARSLERLGSGPLPPKSLRAPIPGSGEKVLFSRLFAPELRKTSLITASMWFLTSLVSFGLVTWIPSIYVGVFKIPVADALRHTPSSPSASSSCRFSCVRRSIASGGARPRCSARPSAGLR